MGLILPATFLRGSTSLPKADMVCAEPHAEDSHKPTSGVCPVTLRDTTPGITGYHQYPNILSLNVLPVRIAGKRVPSAPQRRFSGHA